MLFASKGRKLIAAISLLGISTLGFQSIVSNPAFAVVFTISPNSEIATAGVPIAGYTLISFNPGSVYTISPAVGNGLSFNITTGQLTGTPLVAALMVDYTITEMSAGFPSQHFQITVNSGAPPPPFAILVPVTGTPVPEVETLYSSTPPFVTTGATGLVTFAVTAGSLPSLITVDPSSGAISGTPPVGSANSYPITVTATDSGTHSTANVNLTVLVAPAPFTIPPPSGGITLAGQVGVALNTPAIVTSGGAAPVQYTLTSGSLPSGVTVNVNTGALSGTPPAIGIFLFQITATDSSTPTSQTAILGESLTVSPAFVATPIPDPKQEGSIKGATIEFHRGHGYTLLLTGSFPRKIQTLFINNVSQDKNLILQDATFVSIPLATDQLGTTLVVDLMDGEVPFLSWTIDFVLPLIVTFPTNLIAFNATAGTPISTKITTTGGRGSITYSVSPKYPLPEGLKLKIDGGITGTPKKVGIFNVTLTASDGEVPAKTATVSFTIRVGPGWVNLTAGPPASTKNWQSITSSSDGTHFAAVASNGDIWTSTDSGVNWTDQESAGSRSWRSITSSSDGTHLAAAVNNGDIWTSTDSGVNWTDQKSVGSQTWQSITSSNDGTHLAAAVNNGDIWTSTDSGVNWSDQKSAGSRNWESITSSSDGTHLAAAVNHGDIWTSTDSGVNWSDQKSAGSRGWASITSSSDGTHLAAVVFDRDIWTSTDSGVNWSDQKSAGSRNWVSITSSSDGTHLAAVVFFGDIWTSTDSGVNWTDQKKAGQRFWESITSSSDGTHLAAGGFYGDIWGYTGLSISATQSNVSLLNNSSFSVLSKTTLSPITLTSTGGVGVVTISVDPKTRMPDWLNFDAISGILSEIPNARPASATLTFDAIDSFTPAQSTQFTLQFNVKTPLAITSVSLSPQPQSSSSTNRFPVAILANTRVTINITGTGFGITASDLSAVLIGSSRANSLTWITGNQISAEVTGVTPGTYDVQVIVKGQTSPISTNDQITVLAPATFAFTQSKEAIDVGAPLTSKNIFGGSGGVAITPAPSSTDQISWSITPTTPLQAGVPTLALDAATGLLTTTAKVAGTFTYNVTLSIDGVPMPSTLYTLTVVAPLVISAPANLTSLTATTGTPFSTKITTTGGRGSITYSLSTKTLPPEGLNLNPDGTITGTPKKVGIFNVTLTASDGEVPAKTATVSFTISVGSGWVNLTAGSPASTKNWQSITSSSDGTHLAAVVDGGDIWTSTDSGVNWTDQKSVGSRGWVSITSSSDGTHLAAAVDGGDIWTSTDSGVNWTDQKKAGQRLWRSITSSSDGTHLAATVYGGDIWTSTDSGVNWTDQKSAGSRGWVSITSSSDGTHLAAVVYPGDIWTSTDSGVNWSDQKSARIRGWVSITSSSDGTHLAAADERRDIWTSTDSGVNWTDQKKAVHGYWQSITSSSDGIHLAAAVSGGDIWTSTDSGVNWTDQKSAGSRRWAFITSSSDGTHLAAAVSGGDIWGYSD